jgi:hypothetical protein
LRTGTSHRGRQRIIFPFTGLRLLLPAIAPSWRFFDAVSDSPRVDYAVLRAPDDEGGHWQEFRPRPPALHFFAMLRRLFWNAQWNENLFLVSLAERMMGTGSAPLQMATQAHSERELLLRVARHLHRSGACDEGAYLQIRLRFVGRTGPGDEVSSQIAYESGARLMAELITP